LQTHRSNQKSHHRFIALWLVDSTKRIISTVNVPPQQMTWYTDSIIGANRREALAKLPAELVAILRAESLTAEDAAILAEKSMLPKELLDMVR
jgi:hypothetical protein